MDHVLYGGDILNGGEFDIRDIDNIHDTIEWLNKTKPERSLAVLHAPEDLDLSNALEFKEWWTENVKPYEDAEIRTLIMADTDKPSKTIDTSALPGDTMLNVSNYNGGGSTFRADIRNQPWFPFD